jgi:hypothetical protein
MVFTSFKAEPKSAGVSYDRGIQGASVQYERQKNSSPTESMYSTSASYDSEYCAGTDVATANVSSNSPSSKAQRKPRKMRDKNVERRAQLKNVTAPPSTNELLFMKKNDDGKHSWEKFEDSDNKYTEFAFHSNGLVYANENGVVHTLATDNKCRIRLKPQTTEVNRVKMERMSHWDRERNQEEVWNGHLIRDGKVFANNPKPVISERQARQQLIESYNFESDPAPYIPPDKRRKPKKYPLNVKTNILNGSILDDAEHNSISQSPIAEMPQSSESQRRKGKGRQYEQERVRLGRRDNRTEEAVDAPRSELDGFVRQPLANEPMSREVRDMLIQQKRNDFDAQLARHHSDENLLRRQKSKTKIAPSAQRQKVPVDEHESLKLKHMAVYSEKISPTETNEPRDRSNGSEKRKHKKNSSSASSTSSGKKSLDHSPVSAPPATEVPVKSDSEYDIDYELYNGGKNRKKTELAEKDQEIEMLKKELERMKMNIIPSKSHQNRIDTNSSSNSLANDGEEITQEPKEVPEIKSEEPNLNDLDNHPLNKPEPAPKKKNRFMCLPSFGKKKNKKNKEIDMAAIAPGAVAAIVSAMAK